MDLKKNLLFDDEIITICIRGSGSIKHEQEKDTVEELASYSEALCSIT